MISQSIKYNPKDRFITDCYTTTEEGVVRPWTPEEKKEIAQLRKKGWEESRIRGWMKTGNNRKGDCPPLKETKPMATKKVGKKKGKAKTSKKVTKKSSKKVTKKPGRKAAAKPGRKPGGFQVGDTLTAVKGKDDEFYKKFPRYTAYQLICKKGKMDTAKFVDAVEKFPDVKNRAQALGILTKLLEKGCVKASGKKKAA